MSAPYETLHPTFIEDTRDINLRFPDLEDETLTSDKYTVLGAQLYRSFMDEYRGTGSSSGAINHGFKIVGKVIARAPAAYCGYASSTGLQPSVDLLSKILLRSFATAIKPLAATDNDRNTIMEAHLGLIGGGNTAAYEMSSVDGVVYYQPKELELSFAEDEIVSRTVRGYFESLPATRRCLALPYVLPSLWSCVAKGCATDPRYFAADMQSLTAASQ